MTLTDQPDAAYRSWDGRAGERRVTEELRARHNNAAMHDIVLRYVTEREMSGDIARSSYDTIRRRLMAFAAHCSVHPCEVTKHDVRAWISSCQVRPATSRAYISAVAGLYRWMGEEDLVAHDPTVGIRRPKVPKGENRSLSDEDLARLDHVLPDLRAQTIVSLMLNEGLRVAEVTALQVYDVDLTRGHLHVRGKGYRGERSRTVPMTDRTLKLLGDYIASERLEAGPAIRTDNGRKGLTSGYVTKLVLRWMEDAGIKRHRGDGVSAHALRHTAAEQVAELTDDLRIVQGFLGHQNFATTQTYLRRETKGIAEVQRRRGLGGEVADGGDEQSSVVPEVPQP